MSKLTEYREWISLGVSIAGAAATATSIYVSVPPIIQELLIIATLCLFIVFAVELIKSRWPKWRKRAVGAAFGVFVVAFFALAVIPSICPAPVAHITSPQANSTQGLRVNVVGNSQNVQSMHNNICDSHKMWLVVYSYKVGAYYRQGDSNISLGDTGDWHGVVTLGTREFVDNNTYDIMAVLANNAASSEFQRAGPGSPLYTLPQGTTVLDRVTITRGQ